MKISKQRKRERVMKALEEHEKAFAWSMYQLRLKLSEPDPDDDADEIAAMVRGGAAKVITPEMQEERANDPKFQNQNNDAGHGEEIGVVSPSMTDEPAQPAFDPLEGSRPKKEGFFKRVFGLR